MKKKKHGANDCSVGETILTKSSIRQRRRAVNMIPWYLVCIARRRHSVLFLLLAGACWGILLGCAMQFTGPTFFSGRGGQPWTTADSESSYGSYYSSALSLAKGLHYERLNKRRVFSKPQLPERYEPTYVESCQAQHPSRPNRHSQQYSRTYHGTASQHWFTALRLGLEGRL